MPTGNDGGITTSADAGKTWTNTKNTGLVTQEVYAIDGASYMPGVYMIGMQDNNSKQRAGPTSSQWNLKVFTGKPLLIQSRVPETAATCSLTHRHGCASGTQHIYEAPASHHHEQLASQLSFPLSSLYLLYQLPLFSGPLS